MPGLDHTGPMGKGAMTGRGQGDCRDTADAQADQVFGVGRGGRPWGGGRGRVFGGRRGRGGFGRGWFVQRREAPVDEATSDTSRLHQQVRELEAEVASLRKVLEDRDSDAPSDA
jgi:hypothetical protein